MLSTLSMLCQLHLRPSHTHSLARSLLMLINISHTSVKCDSFPAFYSSKRLCTHIQRALNVLFVEPVKRFPTRERETDESVVSGAYARVLYLRESGGENLFIDKRRASLYSY